VTGEVWRRVEAGLRLRGYDVTVRHSEPSEVFPPARGRRWKESFGSAFTVDRVVTPADAS